MKLIAIYNVWGDSIELLKGSIGQIREHVDFVLIVAQEYSNTGEHCAETIPFCNSLIGEGLVDKVINYAPKVGYSLMQNETAKRQLGIDFAIDNTFTHFLHLDSDEYYEGEKFLEAKEIILRMGYDGSVLSLWTYYKDPTLRLKNKEKYGVPFIHKVYSFTKCGIQNRNNYPKIVDPTRAINVGRVGVFVNCVMHHYSYVRRDIEKKLRNSTARNNINREKVLREYYRAQDGTHLRELFNDTLIRVPNYFNININEKEKTGG